MNPDLKCIHWFIAKQVPIVCIILYQTMNASTVQQDGGTSGNLSLPQMTVTFSVT